MLKRIILASLLGMVVLLSIVACSLLREPEQASGPIEAIPLTVITEPAQPGEPEMTTQEAPPVATTISGDAAPSAEGVGGELTVYRISPGESSVRFELEEDLRGQRTTVVGSTDQVAGEIALNSSNPSTTQVGIIQVNARTLATNNNLRNRAIQNRILNTGDYEFITFAPTAIDGLPDSVRVGEAVNFTIAGDLTIREITQQVTFDVQATLVTENHLTGTASTVINRTDFDLAIPRVPHVANVEEQVELAIDFVANSV